MKHKPPAPDQNQKADASPSAVEDLNRDEIDFAASADEVARRAYFSYVNQGAPSGRDVQHWLEAEAELIAERNLTRVHGFDHQSHHKTHHPPNQIKKATSHSDWEQAERELPGDAAPGSKDAVLESAPESERCDPVPGSPGHKVPATPSADADAEGRSAGERLVAAGIAAAEHDQMLRANRAAAKKDL